MTRSLRNETIFPSVSPSSSSSRTRSRETDGKKESDTLQCFEDEQQLIRYACSNLGLPPVDALRAVERWGAVRCERAYFKTLADMKGKTGRAAIRSPGGLFIAVLNQGREYTAAELALHLEFEDDAVDDSNNVTLERLTREEQMLKGSAPENVVQIQRVQ